MVFRGLIIVYVSLIVLRVLCCGFCVIIEDFLIGFFIQERICRLYNKFVVFFGQGINFERNVWCWIIIVFCDNFGILDFQKGFWGEDI